MLYALGCAGLALRQAFSSDYVLADDVRQHVFWMFRFLDPTLFQMIRSLIISNRSLLPDFGAISSFICARNRSAACEQSHTVPLGLLTVAFFFGAAVRLLRSAPVASLAAILLCQCLWLSSDLCSATPRAFFYPLFSAFLYYHVTNRQVASLDRDFTSGSILSARSTR